MAKALYRTYRSRSLDEIVGQEHVTSLLKRAIETDRVAHAYLFTGPRGVGKTSIARILAHEINHLPYSDDSNHLDIIEIDAASNNGVEDIRDLREKVQLAPIKAPKKIYIIDEVHMLSKPAFNALLKTLEEPPAHVVFILATTDVEKLPATIISRTQRHNFSRANDDNIVKNLERIAASEKITIEQPALERIAAHSDGSFRDSVGLLDQLSSLKPASETITSHDVESSLGLAGDETISEIIAAVKQKKLKRVLELLDESQHRGIQAKTLAAQLSEHIRRNAAGESQLLGLLEKLLEINTSSLPQYKLLAVLGMAATPARSEASQISTSPAKIIDADIPELAKKATEPHPKDRVISSPKISTPEIEKADATQTTKNEVAEPPKQTVTPEPLNTTFDSEAFKAFCAAETIALKSMLAKCDIDFSGTTLEIYARTLFYKKKLESVRFSQVFRAALADQNLDNSGEIQIYASTKPTGNSQIDAVTAIMGGGEEVDVENDA